MEHPEAFGAFGGLWCILDPQSILVLCSVQGAQSILGCSDPEPCGKSWTSWSIPGPSEHPKLLGTPQTPGDAPDSWEHPGLLGTPQIPGDTPPAHVCPEEQPRPPGPSRILTAAEAPERPPNPNPWEPLEHPESSGAPRECLSCPSSHLPAGLSGSIPLTAPTAAVVPPIPSPQPPGRAGRCRKEFPKSPEFPKPLFFIKIKSDSCLLHSAVQGLLKSRDLQEKSP